MTEEQKFRLEAYINGIVEQLAALKAKALADKKEKKTVEYMVDLLLNNKVAAKALELQIITPQNHKKCNRTGILGRTTNPATGEVTITLCSCTVNKTEKAMVKAWEAQTIKLDRRIIVRNRRLGLV